MNCVTMAVFDSDALYCERLSEYLRSHLKLSFEIMSFTEGGKLLEYLDENEIALLVVSESDARGLNRETFGRNCRNIMILDEDGKNEELEELSISYGIGIFHVSKYLPAAEIVDRVLELCISGAEGFSGLKVKALDSTSKLLGFYTPVSRCGQTSFSIKMGEALARKGRTILLSFESFSAITSLFEQEAEEDITDLLYFADCERDKFCLYLEKIKRTRNGLDFIAPAKTAMQVKEISYEKIRELVELLAREAGYQYILFDLKDYPDGFFEILDMCDIVYTVMRNNSADHYRLGRYDKALLENDYERVLTKTMKCLLPDGRDITAYNRFIEDILIRSREVTGVGA
ncbi:hypothetical protein [Butyrivibrio sp. VCB2001]|uniref:hypothetical protein n=1 Tax=Butyrivibrio sp. VCB2001 TaxID=1280667 RepID=UPI0004035237|nr:hypothetical protein [Butyrivibrio sp. VCB2001]